MGVLYEVSKEVEAFRLRRDIRRARKSNGLSPDLEDVLNSFREINPEIADNFERLMYPHKKGM